MYCGQCFFFLLLCSPYRSRFIAIHCNHMYNQDTLARFLHLFLNIDHYCIIATEYIHYYAQ
jgi:hypothetical protein